MILGPATAADLDAIDEIERHSFARPWPRSTFEAELVRDLARLDVARTVAVTEGDGSIAGWGPGDSLARGNPRATTPVIGFCNYWVIPDPQGLRGELHILAIATHPDHRRAGVGAALVGRAIDQARAQGCTLGTLEVRRGNVPAIALYERAGFRTVHVRKRYYQDNGEDALVMLSEWSP
jgi:ribosomal-protein-alanine N-acetyltransferase